MSRDRRGEEKTVTKEERGDGHDDAGPYTHARVREPTRLHQNHKTLTV